MALRVAFASDHAGVTLRQVLQATAEELGFATTDLGTTGEGSVDYPDFADRLARVLETQEAERGVLVCGTGIGISIAANRHRHIRAALCHDVTTVRLARQHNDANVLALGARTIGVEVAQDCLRAFLSEPFQAGRHAARVAKLG